MKKYTIVVKNSEADNLYTETVLGSKEKVKEYLAGAVAEDRYYNEYTEEAWDMGDDIVIMEEIEEDCDVLSFHAIYDCYHIDYYAIPEKEIKTLE